MLTVFHPKIRDAYGNIVTCLLLSQVHRQLDMHTRTRTGINVDEDLTSLKTKM